MGVLFHHVVHNDGADDICTEIDECVFCFPWPSAQLGEFVGEDLCKDMLHLSSRSIECLPELPRELFAVAFLSPFERYRDALHLVLHPDISLRKQLQKTNVV